MKQESRRPPRRTWLLLAALSGATIMYFADPDTGGRRRHVTADRLVAEWRRLVRQDRAWMRHLSGIASGAIQEIFHLAPPNNLDPDDRTITDRVENEVLRDPRFGKAPININTVDGVVELRGELPHPQDIDDLVARVRGIPGVRDVHSFLHLPNTPPPNKQSAITAQTS